MNNTLTNLLNAMAVASAALSKAEQARDMFLEPILKALGATGGSVSHCSIDGGELHITRTGSSRGYRWDDDHQFPLSLFTCEDPLKAASEYVAEKKQAKEQADRLDKLNTLRRLRKELNIE